MDEADVQLAKSELFVDSIGLIIMKSLTLASTHTHTFYHLCKSHTVCFFFLKKTGNSNHYDFGMVLKRELLFWGWT